LLGLAVRRAGMGPHGRTCRGLANRDHSRARLATGSRNTPLSIETSAEPETGKTVLRPRKKPAGGAMWLASRFSKVRRACEHTLSTRPQAGWTQGATSIST
jgi:hypothetical protein